MWSIMHDAGAAITTLPLKAASYTAKFRQHPILLNSGSIPTPLNSGSILFPNAPYHVSYLPPSKLHSQLA
ncbi:hypothetical protein RRG08_058505 [Elysia crispata]|uniref:Uncharacterized protein n=1 Tax=Elysia crispata TaxID=231223 RepID=A0AAE0ZWK5_9GAST|nr:hypothetical protein RRG08_058505 [Elysia crispata]